MPGNLTLIFILAATVVTGLLAGVGLTNLSYSCPQDIELV